MKYLFEARPIKTWLLDDVRRPTSWLQDGEGGRQIGHKIFSPKRTNWLNGSAEN